MKLLCVEAFNLNSLYGQHTVDFEAALGGASLFLIYGPTGSGKSTIMDAVSLALFGKTPRLHAKQGDPTADPRAIMSRGTGECAATLVFSKLEASSRQTYRAKWTCHRARKKADGAWRPPVRSLERREADGAWTMLASSHKRKEFGPEFEKVLEGFSVADFNRSMLLAQGQFDAFLGAKPQERAEILERLTDTAVFQQLGERAARVRGRHEQRLKALRTLAGAGGGLEPERLARVEQEHAEHTAAQDAAQRAQKRSVAHLGWVDEDLVLQTKLQEAQVDKGALLAEVEEAKAMLSALAEHERCVAAGAFSLLDAHGVATRNVVRQGEAIAALDAALPELRQGSDAAATAAAAAGTRQAAAEEHLKTLRPLVIEATTASKARQVATAQVKDSEGARDNAAESAGVAEAELTVATTLLETAVKEAAAAREALEAHAADAVFVEAWPPIRTRLAKCVADSGRLAREGQGHQEQAGQLAADRAGLKSAQDSYDKQRSEVIAPLNAALELATAALAGLLPEGDYEVARASAEAAIETARVRRDAIKDALAPVREAKKHRKDLLCEEERVAGTAAEHAAAQASVEALEAAVGHALELASQAKAGLERTRLVAGFAGHRPDLVADEACPLCGSEAHPWVGDAERAAADAQVDQLLEAAKREVQDKKTAHASATTAWGAGKGGLQTLAGRLGAEQDAVAQAKQRREASTEVALRMLKAAGLAADCVLAEVDEALDRATVGLAQSSGAHDALEMSYRAVGRADRAKQEAVEAQRKRYDELEVVRATLEQRRTRLQDDRVAHAVSLEQVAAERGDCRGMLEGHGVPLADDDPMAWRALGEQRCADQQARRSRAESSAAQTRVAVVGHEGAVALVKERTESRDGLVRKVEQQRVVRDDAVTNDLQALEALTLAWAGALAADEGRPDLSGPVGVVTPDLMLQAQQAWEARAVVRAKEAATAAQTSKDALETNRTKRELLAGQLVTLNVELQQARSDLDGALETLELGGDDPLRQARIEKARLAELRARKRGLDDRGSRLTVLLKERREGLQEHVAERPGTLAEAPVRADLEAALVVTKEALEVADGALQETGDTLRDHERAVLAQKDNSDKLLEAEKEAEVWLTLHDYIGKNDGGKFKEFAQALNLRQLLDRANVHLERLNKRYLLVPRLEGGLPTLEFDLEDRWQIGERSAPRSLSGGERFLVSLSLALGLSDFRSVKMPIETLLLDEGFGTLDMATLNDALAALGQLQADGRQVGIISHVVALQEQVPARIEVRPLGGGKSKIVIEAH